MLIASFFVADSPAMPLLMGRRKVLPPSAMNEYSSSFSWSHSHSVARSHSISCLAECRMLSIRSWKLSPVLRDLDMPTRTSRGSGFVVSNPCSWPSALIQSDMSIILDRRPETSGSAALASGSGSPPPAPAAAEASIRAETSGCLHARPCDRLVRPRAAS